MPAEIGRLSLVRTILLYSNSLTGEGPTEIGELSLVRTLYLSSNSLTGKVPTEIGRLSLLQSLYYLSSNGLTGEVPTEIGGLSSLSILDLSYNSLSGIAHTDRGNRAADLRPLFQLVRLPHPRTAELRLLCGVPLPTADVTAACAAAAAGTAPLPASPAIVATYAVAPDNPAAGACSRRDAHRCRYPARDPDAPRSLW